MFGKLRDSWCVWRRKVSEKFEKFNPEPKTEEMTVPVGVDSEGRLWTSGEGGGGGGGTKCYRISITNGKGYGDGSFNLNVTVPFDFEVATSTGLAIFVEKNNSVTLNVVWSEDVQAEFHCNNEMVSNTFIYAKEYTTTDYTGNAEQDPISKFITVEEVTL